MRCFALFALTRRLARGLAVERCRLRPLPRLAFGLAPFFRRGLPPLGAFFGLVTYATYDLTNHATVKNWPWIVTVVDLCWGAVLSASVCCIGYLAGRWLGAA